jgi:tRNA modification GTPase
MPSTNSTIAAIATAPGVAAIGIIRLSGADAIATADRVFRSKLGRGLSEIPAGRIMRGVVVGTDLEPIDECLVVCRRAPNSYTGEDTAELHCHGSPTALAEILRAVLANGARQAEPGEFTKRAFLNGRLDLTQAEAVIDVIEAETVAAAKNAAAQLGGAIARRIDDGYGELLDIAAHFHATVDYPDEDIDDFQAGEYAFKLGQLENSLRELYDTFERGKVLKNGVAAAIIGKPNVGKSSLLNALVGFDRAIVTAKPGTTRDTIEERAVFGGTLTRLIDTAGLRGTRDEAEAEGVERAIRAARDAELVIAVFDGSEKLTDEDTAVLTNAKNAENAVAVVTKADLPPVLADAALGDGFSAVVRVSSKTGEGVSALSAAIIAALPEFPRGRTGEIITNARQAEAVERAAEYVRAASLALARGVTPDAALVEIESALNAIGEITGRNIREDTLERIFERFCVGK